MKSFVCSLVLMVAFSAQAVKFECFSLEENVGGADINVVIGNSFMTSDGMGHNFRARPVRITQSSTRANAYADGVGTATTRKIEMHLLQGGDMMMGELTAQADGRPGRLSGSLRMSDINGGHKLDVDCVVKR